MRLLPSELWSLIVLVVVVGAAVLLAGQAFPAEPAPDYHWPQVTRVVHPEDLDRCG